MTDDAQPDPRVQMNVRLPKSLVDKIDERRKPRGLSRDKAVERALTWAYSQPVVTRQISGRTPTGRTATNPRRTLGRQA